MSDIIYTETNSRYLEENPTWHVEDSPWKATQVIEILRRNNINPQTVVEVGCGAGEILNQLYHHLDSSIQYSGYEIAPDAYRLSKGRTKDRLTFYQEDFLLSGNHSDVLL